MAYTKFYKIVFPTKAQGKISIKMNRKILMTGVLLSLAACQQTLLGEKREEVVITLHKEVSEQEKSTLPPFGPDVHGEASELKPEQIGKKPETIPNVVINSSEESPNPSLNEGIGNENKIQLEPVSPNPKQAQITELPEIVVLNQQNIENINRDASVGATQIDEETYSPFNELSDEQLQAELQEAARIAEQQLLNKSQLETSSLENTINETVVVNEVALPSLDKDQLLEKGQSTSVEPLKVEEEKIEEYIGERTKIGLMLPLSSPDRGLRHIAENLRDAALLALFDQKNKTVEMVIYDTNGTRIGTQQAAEKAIDEDVDLILGPLLSESVQTAAVIARRANVPMMSFNNRLDAAGKGVYILGNSPRFEVENIFNFAKSKGVRKIHILAPDNVYGSIVVDAARGHAEMNNLKITGVDYYNSGDTDFTELAKKVSRYYGRRAALKSRIKQLEARSDEVAKRALRSLSKKDTLGPLPYDAILIPALNQFSLRTLTAQLSQYGVDQPDVRILGLSAWDEMGTISNEPQLVGSWYASHPDSGWNLFARHFKKQFGYLPENITSIAYEAVALSSLLAGQKYEPDFSAEKLHLKTGYQGVRGLFRLSRFGYAERLLAIKEISKNGVAIAAPAPDSFNTAY